MSKALSEHFLYHFLCSQEPFAVIGGRLYTLNRTRDNNEDYTFCFLGKRFALEESEEVSQLEKELFIAKRSDIQRMMTQHIKVTFQDRIKSIKTELEHMQDLYESMQDTSIEKFIMIDVFNVYNREERKAEEEAEVEVSQWDYIPEIGRIPGIEEIISRKNSLDPLIGACGFIVIDKECYILYENDRQRDENRGYVVFRNNVLDLRSWIQLQELCDAYSQQLLERINQKAEEHGEEFVEILEQMDKVKDQLDKAIKQKQRFSKKTHDKRGQIGFRKIGECQYQITTDIPAYIIEKNDKYYAFKATTMYITIKTRDNQVMINHAPRLLDDNYVHPFRRGKHSICYGVLNWERHKGVKFNHWYDLTNRKAIARKIAETLREGKNTLEIGYVGGAVVNGHNIEHCNCRIADNRADAEDFAKANEIPLERIIKND